MAGADALGDDVAGLGDVDLGVVALPARRDVEPPGVGGRQRVAGAVLVGALVAVRPQGVAGEELARERVVVAALQVVEAAVRVVDVRGVAQRVALRDRLRPGRGHGAVVTLEARLGGPPVGVVAVGGEGLVLGVLELEDVAAVVGKEVEAVRRAGGGVELSVEVECSSARTSISSRSKSRASLIRLLSRRVGVR